MPTIAFGLILEGKYEWDDSPFYGDIENWWFTKANFPYDRQNFTDEKLFEEYVQKIIAWIKENPCPVININNYDYDVTILAIPSSVIEALYGVKSFDIDELTFSGEDYTNFVNFCYKYVPLANISEMTYFLIE